MKNRISNRSENLLKEVTTSKKIAFVSNTAWSIYNFRIDIVRSFLSKGYDVYAIAPRDSYVEKIVATGAHFIDLPLKKYSFNPLLDLKVIFRLSRIYTSYRFDHIFHYTIKPNIYGSVAAKLAGSSSNVPVVTGLGRMHNSTGLLRLLIVGLYRGALRNVSEVWFLNEENAEFFKRQNFITSQAVRVLPSEGINTQVFRSQNKHPRTNKYVRFLFAGRLLKEKGVLVFYDAAKRIKASYHHVKFEIIGFIDEQNPDSITIDEIDHWQQSGIINYLGATEDIRPYLDRCDCVVFPSYYQEGISRILLEAASMSKPIITTDHVGCRNVVLPQHNGLLCSPRSVNSLVSAIIEFLALSDYDKREYGQNGRQLVKERFRMELVIQEYESYITEMKFSSFAKKEVAL